MRGEEILSGAQRVHTAKLLEENMRRVGIEPDSMKEYVDGFRCAQQLLEPRSLWLTPRACSDGRVRRTAVAASASNASANSTSRSATSDGRCVRGHSPLWPLRPPQSLFPRDPRSFPTGASDGSIVAPEAAATAP